MKKTKKLMALAFASIFAFAGCQAKDGESKSTENSDTVKIGAIIPQTGPVSNYGNSSEKGALLAVEEINKNGGINGKKIEWVSYDDKGEITDSTTAYNKLKGENVAAIVGPITSKPALAVSEIAKKDKIPMITPTGTQVNITEGKDNIFRTCFTDPYQGKLLAIFASENQKAKKVAILRNTSSDYSNGIADEFKKEAEKLKLDLVADESYGDNDNDFKAQLTKIAKASPDVLLIPDYYEKIALIVPQARDAGIKAKFIGSDGWDGVINVMDKSQLNLVDGSCFSNHFALDSADQRVKDFVKKFKDKNKEDPSAFSALSYDTVYLLKQAMEEAKSEDKDKVVEKIKNIEFDGITGKFKFNEDNNPIKSASMMEIKDGAYKFNSIVKAD
ncbi:ABC transporter substrate-binding protein [Anaerococcus hydrogenalis]|uniref:Amino acid-binding protein n=1 Tax=Anaerococcus hydrogenalis TaxID=33029 RepID=A0A2N6UJZ9_9FIRM|nr:ABC transporter substrate-binding protein [Anaerococcus hydrogenalis]MDK7694133.1 ABC transporter substrate-binding protein [Anaerococcus hydrogenalis]MDK7695911.1 ABC transporter substrate-binding protein [Anaerococcus hydrogenalis]MDK7707160.1 ABC transporter substrate-binding protein [Anaerococcus hydrogenalis]PMC82188.1 amino acid-binding protein [Anaerococcus hydrogenalis]